MKLTRTMLISALSSLGMVAASMAQPFDPCAVDVVPPGPDMMEKLGSQSGCALLGPVEPKPSSCCPWYITDVGAGVGEMVTSTNQADMKTVRFEEWPNAYNGPTRKCGEPPVPAISVSTTLTSTFVLSGEAKFTLGANISQQWKAEASLGFLIETLGDASISGVLTGEISATSTYGASFSRTETRTTMIGTPQVPILVPCGLNLTWTLKSGPLTVTNTAPVFSVIRYDAQCGGTPFSTYKNCANGTITSTVVNATAAISNNVEWIVIRPPTNPCNEFCP